MDKLPRLRRKPKPPAIETSVERTSSDIEESALPAGAASEIAAAKAWSKPVMKNSSLRSFKLLVTAKRARTQSPAARPRSSPPVAMFNQDGVAPRSAAEDTLSAKGHGRPSPIMPAFLSKCDDEIRSKFQELTWAERYRLAQGARSDIPLNRWGSFKQTDVPTRGVMDRYINIKPWNHNRVRLHVADGAFDYVNASTITLDPLRDESLPPLRYIAMQGPTLSSFTYVWRMIAEQTASPAVIVQLTNMVESQAVKCHQYFPDDTDDPVWTLNEEDIWNDGWKAKITYDSQKDAANGAANGAIEKRRLLLHVDGEAEPRVIWHLLYTRWPDFGVPTLDDMESFLQLMQMSRDHNNASYPRIVHCSAGVGRTGTFIGLEHLMRELNSGTFAHLDGREQQQPDPIYDTVDQLRQQRRLMVQSETQYRFLYDVLRKLWQDKHGVVVQDDAADDDTGTSEPAPKRLEVAEEFSQGSNTLSCMSGVHGHGHGHASGFYAAAQTNA
ncbi:hypothetical protein E4U42_007779 [Claviceps africana]|uniref:Protein-tyrosine phosphatase 2 n=1 Tax=Claviceps africana TaxID=83212 RepID=A0A8K0J6C2_9HYPO|nr:hypothetical protein E4U42_007779 [Claviceps africana]